jgi:hypothetical protein
VNYQKVEPALSSPFFVALFEALLGHRPTVNGFIGIQIGLNNEKRKALLIHLMQCGKVWT